MRHRKSSRTLDRKRGARRALLRTLMRSLFFESRITTTSAKALEVRSLAERMITHGKESTLAARRYLIARTGSAELADHILKTVAPKYKEKRGGYTRIMKKGTRPGDGAEEVILELV